MSVYTTVAVPTEDGHSNCNRQHPFDWCGLPVYGPNLPTPRNSRVIKSILRAVRLSCKLLGQGYVMERLKSFLRKIKRTRSDSVLWQKSLHQQKNPKSNMTTQIVIINFDYTTFAGRLRTVIWSNDSHPTGVVKLVYGIITFHLTTKAV